MAQKTVKEEVKEEIKIVGSNKEEINIINPSLQNKLKDIQNKEKEEVSVVAPTKKAEKPVTMVRVMLNKDHRCSIGGEWYTFKKGKQYNVPENVKTILKRANLLLPL